MKIFNFRPFLIIAIAIISAILLCVFVVESQITRFFIFLFAALGFLILLITYFIKKKKFLLFISLISLFIAIPFLLIIVENSKLEKLKSFENIECEFIGKIDEHYKITQNDYLKLVVDDVEIKKGEIVYKIDWKIEIYTNPDYFDLASLEIGRFIYAKTSLDFNFISSNDKWEMFNISKDVVATGFCEYQNIIIYDEKDFELSHFIKNKVLTTLEKTEMSNYQIAYAMIFGDTGVIDGNIKDIYQNTGIAHLLAVSGLHVSAIVFVLTFLLKKMKVSHKTQLLIISIFLLFYAYVCNFSISIIRAGLMAIILNYSYIRGKPYDILSVLAMIASFILLFDPLQLFNISFILSFLAVLSIILLADIFDIFFDKIFYSKFAKTLSVLFGIQLGLSITTIFYFESINLLGFLANLLSIPIATLSFILILIFMVFAMISPIFYPICRGIGGLFEFITKFNGTIDSFGVSIFIGEISSIFIFVSLLLFFFMSKYCFFNKKIKGVLGVVCAIAYALVFFI